MMFTNDKKLMKTVAELSQTVGTSVSYALLCTKDNYFMYDDVNQIGRHGRGHE